MTWEWMAILAGAYVGLVYVAALKDKAKKVVLDRSVSIRNTIKRA